MSWEKLKITSKFQIGFFRLFFKFMFSKLFIQPMTTKNLFWCFSTNIHTYDNYFFVILLEWSKSVKTCDVIENLRIFLFSAIFQVLQENFLDTIFLTIFIINLSILSKNVIYLTFIWWQMRRKFQKCLINCSDVSSNCDDMKNKK